MWKELHQNEHRTKSRFDTSPVNVQFQVSLCVCVCVHMHTHVHVFSPGSSHAGAVPMTGVLSILSIIDFIIQKHTVIFKPALGLTERNLIIKIIQPLDS